MEAALKEKETSLSTLQEQANTAQAQLEEVQECIKGKYMGFLLKLILGLPRLNFVFSFRAEDTSSIQTLVAHPLLLHLEKASLGHSHPLEHQESPDQLHSHLLLLQIMDLVLLELQGLPL